MKKIIFIMLCGALFFFGYKGINATVPSYEFYPKGINYLDPANFRIIRIDDYNAKLTSISPFKVKANMSYTFCTRYYQEYHISSVNVTQYGANRQVITSSTTITNLENYFKKFTTGSNTVYISYEAFITIDEPHAECLYNDVYYLFEGNTLTPNTMSSYMEAETHLYEGYLPGDLILLEDSYTIDTNLSSPISIQSITSKLKAFDISEGDITSKIEIIQDGYTGIPNKKGNHTIKYQVSNTRGIKTSLNIIVNVIDDVKPYFESNDIITVYTTDNYSVNDFKSDLEAYDSVDGSLSKDIYVITDNYTSKRTTVGVYDVIFGVKDKSNNEQTFTLTVNVLQGDVDPPVFDGIFNVTASAASKRPIDDFLENITIYDNIDKDIPISKAKIIRNDYEANFFKRGVYEIHLEVSDKMGNVARCVIKVTVIDYSNPTFFFSSVTLFMPLTETMNTTEEVIHSLYKTNYIETTDVVIKYNTYEENKQKAGEYALVLETEEKEYSFFIQIVSKADYNIKPKETKKLTFFEKVMSFFKNFYSRVKTFFTTFL